MTDFKIGDKVRVVQVPRWADYYWIGREGTIETIFNKDNYPFYGRLHCDDDNSIMFNIDDVELITPVPAQEQEDTDINLEVVIGALMFAALNHPDQDEAEIFLSYARELIADKVD